METEEARVIRLCYKSHGLNPATAIWRPVVKVDISKMRRKAKWFEGTDREFAEFVFGRAHAPLETWLANAKRESGEKRRDYLLKAVPFFIED